MKFGSVCSGIEAASVAFEPLGFTAQWFSEIEHFPSEVLKYRYPTVPNLGDMTKLTQNETFRASSIDLLVGGTPCQSFSVAGLRGGLADPRGNLMLTFLALADAKMPRWIVWENVPGVLSSNGGKDFGTFLGALGKLGYGFAYRVLDAQHFGVAQRRRRVFVVGYLGDWRPAAAVLFERESLQRNPKPSRKKGQETTTDAEGRVGATGFAGNVESQVAACLQTTCDDYSRADGFNTVIEQVAQPQYFENHAQDSRVTGPHDVGNTVSAKYGMGGGNTPLVSQPISIAENTIGRQPMNGGNGDGFTEDGPMYTLNATGVHGVAQPIPINTMTVMGRPSDDLNPRMGIGIGNPNDPCPTLTKAHSHAVAQPIAVDWRTAQVDVEMTGTLKTDLAKMSGPCIAELAQKSVGALCARDYKGVGNQYADEGKVITSPVTMAIRRLTPKECERLQGFPDDWTKIPYRNKPADQCPDGPRYKACGNSMAVPVMRWIGQRIQLIDTIIN